MVNILERLTLAVYTLDNITKSTGSNPNAYAVGIVGAFRLILEVSDLASLS